jgi:hypothetical protein
MMKTHGVKVLDRILQDNVLEWLVIPVRQCPDEEAERRVIRRHFRVAHEPWGAEQAYVLPVLVRRTRSRVLFRQMSGLQF